MRFLYRFGWDMRGGGLHGLFVATEEEVSGLIGRHIYFGELCGKHSEVEGTIEPGDIEKIELDPETVEKVTAILGETWSGTNPITYLDRDDE